MFLEITTMVLLGSVLGVKWFTALHSARLSENLVSAENDEARFRGRYKKVQSERDAIKKEMNALNVGFQSIESEVLELEEELLEIDQRNAEIKEQIEGRD